MLERPARVRTQKVIYTPTTTDSRTSVSYLCRVIDTAQLIIVPQSSVKRMYDNTAEILINGHVTESMILHKGSVEECRNAWHSKTSSQRSHRVSTQSSDEFEGEYESEEQPVEILSQPSVVTEKSISLASNRPTNSSHTGSLHVVRSGTVNGLKRSRSTADHNLDENENCISATSRSLHGPKRLRVDIDEDLDIDETNENNPQQLNTDPNERGVDTGRGNGSLGMLAEIRQLFDSHQRENLKLFKQLSSKVDGKLQCTAIDLSSFRQGPNDKEFCTHIIVNNKDLLLVKSKDYADYARQILRILFTSEELVSSTLPPGHPHYARRPLNTERFDILHDALRSKYRITSMHYDDFYSKMVRPKLVDFLCDERKRKKKLPPVLHQSGNTDQPAADHDNDTHF